MTSSLATNAVLDNLKQKHYLSCDKEGVPINKQVPLTGQVYTGAGGVSIVPDGSEVLFVNNALAGGVLTINLTSTANFNNMLGKRLKVVCIAGRANNIVIDTTGQATMYGPNGVGDQCTIAGAGSEMVDLDFVLVGSTKFVVVRSVDTVNVTVA